MEQSKVTSVLISYYDQLICSVDRNSVAEDITRLGLACPFSVVLSISYEACLTLSWAPVFILSLKNLSFLL